MFYAAVQFFLDCGQFVLTSFQNQTLLLFVLGFVINRRIVIKVIKYMGHHNACVIRRLLGYNNICAITNNHFFKCLWVQKHFLLFPKFINIARNSKVLPLLLIIHFAQVFHLRSQKFLTFASGYNWVDENLLTLYLLYNTDKTKVNYKSEMRLRLIRRIFFIDHQIILDEV